MKTDKKPSRWLVLPLFSFFGIRIRGMEMKMETAILLVSFGIRIWGTEKKMETIILLGSIRNCYKDPVFHSLVTSC